MGYENFLSEFHGVGNFFGILEFHSAPEPCIKTDRSLILEKTRVKKKFDFYFEVSKDTRNFKFHNKNFAFTLLTKSRFALTWKTWKNSASIKKGIKSQNLYLKDGGELTSDHIEVANVLDNHFINSVRWILSGLWVDYKRIISQLYADYMSVISGLKMDCMKFYSKLTVKK